MKNNTETFVKLPLKLLEIKYVKSKCKFTDSGDPVDVDLTLTDKVIYSYMIQRFNFFKNMSNSKYINPIHGSGLYFDTQVKIAEKCGVDRKSISRFVSKWVEHGFITVKHNYNNRINYLDIKPLIDDCVELSVVDNVINLVKFKKAGGL